jgi:hypothetical protein
MSKFDTIFNNNRTSTNTGTSSQISSQRKYNSFLKEKYDTPKKVDYNYKETEFPDLALNKTEISKTPLKKSENKKYSDITATVNEVKQVKSNPVPPGWTQYSKTKNSHLFDVTYGEKTKRQIEEEQRQEQEEAKLSDPSYIHEKMISTLVKNWARYKIQYDEIHGEGSYDLLYYTDPIYASDEEDYENNNEYIHNYDNYDSHEEYIHNNLDDDVKLIINK